MATHRQCTIDIENGCSNYVLCSPRGFYRSGSCTKPLPLTVGPSKSESAVFSKSPFRLTGAVGVITYDLLNNQTNEVAEKLAVMFSVPFDFNLYSNCYAVGIFDMSKDCDEKLFHEMYKNEQRSFIRGEAKGPYLTYRSHDINITATMTDTSKPVMKVQLSNK
ncbi:DELTA-thalatoxin-Avl1a-like isoform X2 [Centroberyx affinis]|uniref:DELTA-thalatoxin-Avl1a-like isoform X1 n=1 Tax=Centroberyx affinis TaxID=166261 RepID=UPI003A5BD335